MTTLNQRLVQLEARLQSLIEGSAARLFPMEEQMNLPFRLVQAMKSAIQPEESGHMMAPNLYILKVHPTEAADLTVNQSALQDLALIIQQAGLEAGLYFKASPTVKIAPDPARAPQQLNIEARFAVLDFGKTQTLVQDFEMDSSEAVPPNAFLIVDGNSIFPLNETVVNIGRRVDNHLTIEDPRVSRLHAQLRAIKGQYVLFDLKSTGGTFVNGENIKKRTLQPGDVISLAGVPLIFGQDSARFSGDTHASTRPIVSYQDGE